MKLKRLSQAFNLAPTYLSNTCIYTPAKTICTASLFPSPGFFAHNCFWVLVVLLLLLLLFPWNFSFSPNKIFKKKSLCLKILFKLQATAPIQEAFLQFLRSLLCVLTIPLFVPYNTYNILPYLLFMLSFPWVLQGP